MSAIERLVLWLHVAFVIFTIGPVTIAIMSSPRAIRTRNAVVLQYLLVMTRIFGVASLGVLVFGIIVGQQRRELSQAWLTVSMTLFVVALVLLVLIMRDQRRAVAALEAAGPAAVTMPSAASAAAGDEPAGESGVQAAEEPAQSVPAGSAESAAEHVANVERGRIASMAGVVSLIWLAILVLMVWNT